MPISKDDIYVLLQKCAKRKDLAAARHVHSLMISSGLDALAILGDHLIRLFAACGTLVEANLLFCKVANPSAYTWHAIISAHATHGEIQNAIELYQKMQQEGVIMPDKHIFTCTVKACGIVGSLGQGKLLHDQIISSGFDTDLVVVNSLVDTYAKCNGLREAYKVFSKLPNRDVISWSTMIAGCAQHGHDIPALELLQKMQGEGMKPDKVMYLCILKACGGLGALSFGQVIHDHIINSGLQSEIVLGNALIDMYAKCGSLDEALKVFDNLPNRDVVSWSAMITGFTQHDYCFSALDFFWNMQQEGIKPDRVTFLCTLKACGNIGAIGEGTLIHDQILKVGLEPDVVVGSTLIDMHAKCGSLEEARKVLGKLQRRNVVSWNAMIGGYAEHGNCKMALQCFDDMQQDGLHPVASTYTTILMACSHGGLVKEGYSYFNSMKEHHGMRPTTEHFNCMVDLLSRTGRLDEAKELLESMPMGTDISGWLSLLAACRKYGNVKLGEQCLFEIVQLDPNDAAGYVLMSSIYADGQMWEEVDKIHEMRRCTFAWKKAGQAWIEIEDMVHEFFVGEACHLQNYKMYAKGNQLKRSMKLEGYVPTLDAIVDTLLESRAETLFMDPLGGKP